MENQVFTNMIGKTIKEVDGKVGDDDMTFEADDGSVFRFYHSQDCCESVGIEDVCGDLSDLVGSPIVQAEEVTNYEGPEEDAESYTWTFYKFATAKGSVTVRWLGTSNGFYSEGVGYSEKLAGATATS